VKTKGSRFASAFARHAERVEAEYPAAGRGSRDGAGTLRLAWVCGQKRSGIVSRESLCYIRWTLEIAKRQGYTGPAIGCVRPVLLNSVYWQSFEPWGRGSYRVSFINFAAREINCKIVYYGAGLGGKTTNLQWIFDQTLGKTGGKMISLATETDRTLFFDFLPLDLGTIRGFKTRFHLYTVPGQVFYDASRKLILRGVDGVVFVADSQEERMDANVEALENLRENLREHNYDFQKIPYVLQLNKRDLPNVLPVEELKRALLKKNEPTFEAVAFKGVGVFETLKECGRLVLTELKKG